MVDSDRKRLALARQFGATDTIDASEGNAAEAIMGMTGGVGVDVAMEAVGSLRPSTSVRSSSRPALSGRPTPSTSRWPAAEPISVQDPPISLVPRWTVRDGLKW
ncbi:zinc-binding dehydrogenase [Tropicimonas sp. IMCC34043]|uniref:zinc-binding dehydrogenase n=1 Tax=Tropicimonas sp. IMCC34043 TaxID=2248760 RepID=UPI001E525098|nr:zinc-binding dehydrogenase [Tropicimonas sp. IMCC34043]